MGMVFTELLDMVEAQHSLDMVDAVVARAGARGVYTSVGDYADDELTRLVEALSVESGLAVPDLLHAYGVHLFARFVTLYPAYVTPHADALSFLHGLESRVHTEVRKLYAAARPPLFTTTVAPDGAVLLDYASARGLWRFAAGLLDACLAHYGGSLRVDGVEDLSGGAGTHVRFRLVPT